MATSVAPSPQSLLLKRTLGSENAPALPLDCTPGKRFRRRLQLAQHQGKNQTQLQPLGQTFGGFQQQQQPGAAQQFDVSSLFGVSSTNAAAKPSPLMGLLGTPGVSAATAAAGGSSSNVFGVGGASTTSTAAPAQQPRASGGAGAGAGAGAATSTGTGTGAPGHRRRPMIRSRQGTSSSSSNKGGQAVSLFGRQVRKRPSSFEDTDMDVQLLSPDCIKRSRYHAPKPEAPLKYTDADLEALRSEVAETRKELEATQASLSQREATGVAAARELQRLLTENEALRRLAEAQYQKSNQAHELVQTQAKRIQALESEASQLRQSNYVLQQHLRVADGSAAGCGGGLWHNPDVF